MHVVILAAARHPLRQPFAGGLESLTWALVRGLRERGVDVTLFAGPGSDPALGARELEVRPLELSTLARADVSMPPEPWLREHHAYLQVMLELRDRADVDVIHNNSLHFLPLALAQSCRAPMLTTLHTPPTPWLEPAISLMDQTRSRFVAVSHHTARQWSHVTRAEVVHNGVDTSVWTPGPGGDDLVWVGRIVPEKAPHEAIRIALVSGRRIRLAGPIGDPAYFRAQVEPLLGPTVDYLGHLDVPALTTLLGRSAALVVTPEWDEPYGLVAAESLSCGTPVVGYDRGGLAEFVAPDCGVLVRPGDVDAAAREVERVCALDRRRCREHARTSCSLDTMVEAYLDHYTRLSPTLGRAA
ncbi:Glycosyltransferase involved in cell wall bisynthesis [Pedococcus dokdonensis]|uniref:Glycosyltransferase involved in cell wall bisynthesis n=1 Tax=Pedococcus dokdonensis TaxID=443156 RepID=A0A1H0MA91_9MICO|nr:glycosyltransferase family 4 protein [Pedococcus dokdonensis]SDO77324.1 Glycosyltransferase involved in cell wall bisynthesis [Pedococcus dokdonensis]